MRKFRVRKIVKVVLGCVVVLTIAIALFFYALLSRMDFKPFEPGCGWVTDAESFAGRADVAIPPNASDLHFSGCSYGRSLEVAARFQILPGSAELDEFIAKIGFDQPLVAQYEHHSNFSHVYDGESWWQPLPTQNTIGGHVVRSEKFYDILIESRPQADVVYVMMEFD